MPTAQAGNGSAKVAFSPELNPKWLVIGTSGRYSFWHVGSWEPGPVVSREQEMQVPGPLAFATDGSMLAIAWSGQIVKLIDPATGDEMATLSAPDPQVISALCFSPDGSQLAAATNDQVIQLWDLRKIRRQLASMGLDWEPRCASTPPGAGKRALRITVAPLPPKDFQEELRLASEKRQRELPLINAAIVNLSESLKEQSKDVALYVRRASLYRRLEQFDAAVADLKQALDIEPQNADACNELAWIYLTGPAMLRAPREALGLAERAARISPEDFEHWNTLGIARFRSGQFDGAVHALLQAVERNHGEATAHDLFFLAMSYHHLGETTKGRDCYDRALKWWQIQGDLSLTIINELHAFQNEAEALLGTRSR